MKYSLSTFISHLPILLYIFINLISILQLKINMVQVFLPEYDRLPVLNSLALYVYMFYQSVSQQLLKTNNKGWSGVILWTCLLYRLSNRREEQSLLYTADIISARISLQGATKPWLTVLSFKQMCRIVFGSNPHVLLSWFFKIIISSYSFCIKPLCC